MEKDCCVYQLSNAACDIKKNNNEYELKNNTQFHYNWINAKEFNVRPAVSSS